MSRRSELGAASDREWSPDIALRTVADHVATTSAGMSAWYRLAPRPWTMREPGECEALLSGLGLAWRELMGRWLHLRVAWSGFDAGGWAGRHDQWAAANGVPTAAPDWDDWLVAAQREAFAGAQVCKRVWLGVECRAGRRGLGQLAERVAAGGPPWLRGAASRLMASELGSISDELARLDQILAGGALAGTPATPADMALLLTQSCTLGLPAPVRLTVPHGDWQTSDLAGLVAGARWSAHRFAPTLRIEGLGPGGQPMTRHVAIASLGRMGELEVPGAHAPWMSIPDELHRYLDEHGVGVQWSARLRVLPDEQAGRSLRQVADRVDAQNRHYELDHGLAAPPVLARQIAQAAQVRDELDTDHSGLSTRCEGWWRVAVAAPTPEAALAAVDKLRQLFHPSIALEHVGGQYATAREFIPGEPLASTAHRRRMSLRYLAMGLPQRDAVIGDEHGPLIWRTHHSGRPVGWDMWHDIDVHQRSGLTPVIGGLGAGKTFAIGTLAYHALRSAGAYVTLIDPSVGLSRLTQLPELASDARAVDILRAPAGTLNPYRLVPAPAREDYPHGPAGDIAHAREAAAADSQRTTLVISVLTSLLPAAIRRDGRVQALLLDAIHAVGPEPEHDLREVLTVLRDKSTAGQELAGAFGPILSPRGPARLLLGHPDQASWDAEADRLLVLGINGLTLPREGSDQGDWSIEEQFSLAVMHLTSWLAYRRVYQLPRHLPKLVGLDELRALSLLPSGRTLIQQFARDNRKFRARVLVAGQLASDVLHLGGDTGGGDSGLAGLCHDVLVGRTTGADAQADALRLLRLPTSVGHEPVLGSLSPPRFTAAADAPASGDRAGGGDHHPRDFLWRSGDALERVYLDAGGPHLAGLRHALDSHAHHQQPDTTSTTATSTAAQVTTAPTFDASAELTLAPVIPLEASA